MSLTPSYESPLDAVIMRTLAWENYIAKRKPRVKEISEELIQAARFELGKKTSEAHSARQYLQTLREGEGNKGYIDKNDLPIGWENEWRLLYLPPHTMVRQMSYNPITFSEPEKLTGTHEPFDIVLRNSAFPRLRVHIGNKEKLEYEVVGQRGLYMLRVSDGMYIGKTDEFDIRVRQHTQNKNPDFWIFVSFGENSKDYTIDTLNATESFLISLWNEIAYVTNDNRGGEREPAFIYRQQATLLSAAISAIWLWALTRLKSPEGYNNWSIPFKKRSGLADWPECYVRMPPSENEKTNESPER